MKRRWIAGLLALLLCLGAAGCADSGTATDASEDSTAEETTADASEDSAAEDVSAADEDAAADTVSDDTAQEDTSGDAEEIVLAPQQEVGYDGMQAVYASSLNPGTYEITVDSSSSMFVITSCELTVSEDGTMTARLVLSGTGYGYLYLGTGEEAAEASEDAWIADEAGEDETNTFTVPVEALDSEISCAAYSKRKDDWYDRTLVFRADSLPEEALAESLYTTVADLGLSDGSYTAEVTLSGGSGKASVDSPAALMISDGQITATIVWSSSNYDYMIVGEETYYPVNEEGNSVFEIPVEGFDYPMTVLADTTAMSKPYEIEYTLTFSSASVEEIQ